jgi:hypothetical protein
MVILSDCLELDVLELLHDTYSAFEEQNLVHTPSGPSNENPPSGVFLFFSHKEKNMLCKEPHKV